MSHKNNFFSNPYPGEIFNEPYGPNVYEGVIADYKGDAVTPSNFLAILSGNKSAIVGGNGRVIESNKNDNIFVYFADHGAPDILLVIDDTVSTTNFILLWLCTLYIYILRHGI